MHYEKIARKADFILAKLKYLKESRPEDVFEKLRKMNGLRNAIVHAYDSLIVEEI